jgi:hypothetical protein
VRDRVALQECAGRAGDPDPGHGSMLAIVVSGSAFRQRSCCAQLRLRKSRHRIHTAEWCVTGHAAFDGSALLGVAASYIRR